MMSVYKSYSFGIAVLIFKVALQGNVLTPITNNSFILLSALSKVIATVIISCK